MAKQSDIVVLCDFDGTVTELDICEALLIDYGDAGWEKLDEEYAAGRATIQEYLYKQMAMLRGERDILVAAALDRARLRAGFAEFVAFCAENGISFQIVSAGLDFYIEAILAREGLGHLDVTCCATEFAPEGLRVTPPVPLETSDEVVADFKEAIALDHKGRGKRVVYVGDGNTDFAAACRSDHVFARATLLARCREAGKAVTPFSDFFEVRRDVEALLALSPGRPAGGP